MDYDFQTKEELFATLHLITEHIDAVRLREGTKKLMKEKRESFTIMEELSIWSELVIICSVLRLRFAI